MSNNQKDLTLQSYEKKIANTLRSEKYDLPSFKKNKQYLDNIDVNNITPLSTANKFYKNKINVFYEKYVEEFNDLIIPLISEKGLSFDAPEDKLNELINNYDSKISRYVEKLLLIERVPNESFYDRNLIENNWGLCSDGIDSLPLMIALGSQKIILIDEVFDMNMTFFAELGAMPDIRPITKAGNLDLPPNTFSVNLQLMVNTGFKQISLLILKQNMDTIQEFLKFMVNISLVVDTKIEIDEDFSGLKWIKNSLKYSLFKQSPFLNVVKNLKEGGVVIDKSVSPMQVQKIQSMQTKADVNIGFEIIKLGTLQYSILKKNQTVPIAYDEFEEVICKIPTFDNKSNMYSNF